MQYEATSPTHYLSLLDNDWRTEKLMRIREMIRLHVPELKEVIRYKMLAYDAGNDDLILGLNAQKGYVSLYVGNIEKIDHTGELLHGYNMGKGCIRLKKTSVIDDGRIEKFIQRTAEVWRAGGDVKC
jgi:uncharacterized protein YdhG (YjbR/CyaY superfamily)